jgi:SAM-dependent methyltransferase
LVWVTTQKETSVDDLTLLIDLHKDGQRQGPGGDGESERAINLAQLDRNAPLKIADIGCGTGASTLTLARLLNAQITAVDFLQDFLDVLMRNAERDGVSGNITPLCASMDDLPFADGEFDVIWSEGAIYNIGFEKGVTDWCRFLKPGGILVVSEMTWLSTSRPDYIQQHWLGEYPEVDLASSKIAVLEKSGYSPVGYFVLPEHCWQHNYYRPMEARFADFLSRNGNSAAARAIVEAERAEIALYKSYKAYYSYGVYIARKLNA